MISLYLTYQIVNSRLMIKLVGNKRGTTIHQEQTKFKIDVFYFLLFVLLFQQAQEQEVLFYEEHYQEQEFN